MSKRDKLEELARFLMEKEVVEEEDLKRILQLQVAKKNDQENFQTPSN
jgi:ATP-dependent Zn protease